MKNKNKKLKQRKQIKNSYRKKKLYDNRGPDTRISRQVVIIPNNLR